jgi:hypothetical protein
MEQFYIITITVAVVLLILILTYIGVYVMGGSDKTPYPPESLQCPDYWEKSGADCIIPGASTTNAGTRKNTGGLENTPSDAAYISGNVLKTDDASWQTSDGLSAKCAKKLWANNNNVVWDGISNYNSC